MENDGLLKWRFRDLQNSVPPGFCLPVSMGFRIFNGVIFFFEGVWNFGFLSPKKFGQFGNLFNGSIWVKGFELEDALEYPP